MVEQADVKRLGISKEPVVDRPRPEPLRRQVRRLLLLGKRAWYDWRIHRHEVMQKRCANKRAHVVAALAIGDEYDT